nr:hypothetical protein [Nannocystis exedens]
MRHARHRLPERAHRLARLADRRALDGVEHARLQRAVVVLLGPLVPLLALLHLAGVDDDDAAVAVGGRQVHAVVAALHREGVLVDVDEEAVVGAGDAGLVVGEADRVGELVGDAGHLRLLAGAEAGDHRADQQREDPHDHEDLDQREAEAPSPPARCRMSTPHGHDDPRGRERSG